MIFIKNGIKASGGSKNETKAKKIKAIYDFLPSHRCLSRVSEGEANDDELWDATQYCLSLAFHFTQKSYRNKFSSSVIDQ